MVLTEDDIMKFQALYRSKFGVDLDKKEAYEQGIKLISLLSNAYRMLTFEEYELIKKHESETLPKLINKITNNYYENNSR
jgi:hypothetical protein